LNIKVNDLCEVAKKKAHSGVQLSTIVFIIHDGMSPADTICAFFLIHSSTIDDIISLHFPRYCVNLSSNILSYQRE